MPTTARSALARLAERPDDDDAGDILEDLLSTGPAELYEALLGVRRAPADLGETRHRWSDHIDARVMNPARFVRATSLDDLVRAVRYARAHGLHVRAVGSGFSFSTVAVTNGVLVDGSALDHPLPIDFALRPGATERLFRVEAGIKMSTLNEELDARGLALENQASSDGQTLAGYVATATHGSGLTWGDGASCLRSVRLVDGTGKVRQIEPTNGITEPHAFARQHPDVALEQDDDRFHATIVSMGCLGLFHSVVLAVREAYWLRESRVLESWEQVKGSWRAEVHGHRHYELLVSPYHNRGRQLVLVTRRDELGPNDSRHPKGGAGHRNPITQMAMQVKGLDDAMVALSRVEPMLMTRLVERALKGLADPEYVDKSYRVLRLGAAVLRAFSSEFAVPLDHAALAAERLSALAREYAFRHHLVHTSPFAMRFVGASQAYMSPMYGAPTCMIELPFLEGTVGGRELLERYEEALYPLGGRPHFGQLFHLHGGQALVRQMYPKFDAFAATVAALDPDGVFSNTFTRHLGLRTPAFKAW